MGKGDTWEDHNILEPERNHMLKKSNPSRIRTKKKQIYITLIVMKLNGIKENKNQNKQKQTDRKRKKES